MPDVSDVEQREIGRRLHDGQAYREVHQVPARDDAPEPDDEEPGGDGVREEAHSPPPARMAIAWSRNSLQISRNAPATAIPTAMFDNGIVPADRSSPGLPRSRKFLKKTLAKMSPPSPIRP